MAAADGKPTEGSPAAQRGLTSQQITYLVITLVAFLLALGGLIGSYLLGSKFLAAMLAGAVGGIGHEFAQSGGTVAFYKVKDDGVYLGSLAGIPLGAISGLLFFFANSDQSLPITMSQSLLAGLAFKGVVEAAGGAAAPGPQETVTIENIALDIDNNSATVTIRNAGRIDFSVARIYVDNYASDVTPNVSMPHGSSHDFHVQNIRPALVKGGTHMVKVVTAKGTVQTSA